MTQTERRRNYRMRLKLKAIEYMGGKCYSCGYNKSPSALEFHHVNPATKSFTISETGRSKSWETLKNELDKCVIVCANCHREHH